MPEFIPILAVAFVVLILMYGFLMIVPELQLGSPTGHAFATAEDRYMHTLLAEDKWVSSSLWSIAHTEGTVKDEFNGEEEGLILPFQTDTDWFERGMIEFTVSKGEGDLVMLINGDEIYRGATKLGKHYVAFEKGILTGEDFFEIKASRGLVFWDSAYYDVKAEVKGEVLSIINTTFLGPKKYKRAKLIVTFGQNKGKLTININNKLVYEGEPDGALYIDLERLQRVNTIEFLPEVGAKHLVDWAEIRFEK